MEGRTTHVDELSESHSEPKNIEEMRTSSSPNINEVSVQVKIKINGSDLATMFVLFVSTELNAMRA